MATEMQTSVRDIPHVLVTAGRLVVKHWPALLALAFLGVALRAASLWAAVKVSDHSAFLGQLILVLTPLGYLLPIIAMLYLCRDSLEHVGALARADGPTASTERRERRLVDVAVSMLVPFLAVYVSYGLVKADRDRFLNEATFAEFNRLSLSKTVDYDFAGRVGLYPLQVVAIIVAVAWVLRWTLGRIENRTRFLALAFVGALMEVYYTGQVAQQSLGLKAYGSSWVETRRATTGILGVYDGVVDKLGWLGHPIDTVTTWLFAVIGSFDAVIVVPVAWLTVGAVVLGHKLSPPRPHERPDRFARVPLRVRKVTASLLGDIRERWSAFWGGLRLLAAAGLMPMLAFGLVFLLAIRLPVIVSQLVRLVVGPTDTNTWLAFSPMESGLGLALSMAITAPLLAAAVDWLVAARVTSPHVDEPELTEAAEGPRSPAE